MRKFLIILSLFVFMIFACNETALVKVTWGTRNDLKLVPIKSSLLFYFDFAKISDSELAQEFFRFSMNI